jgi:AcrR family transcriptional regulator
MSSFSEQPRSPKSRQYRMRRRAELVSETRRRITEAAIRLHTTVGPAATSLTAVAEEAGVTRLTLYRHFPTQDELFAACRGEWIVRNPRPDATAWGQIEPLDRRLRTAIDQLYSWYADHGDELYPIYRDMQAMPESSQRAVRDQQTAMVDALLGDDSGSAADRALRATVGHVMSFWTWRSLAVDQALPQREAVELATTFAAAALALSPSPSPSIDAPAKN